MVYVEYVSDLILNRKRNYLVKFVKFMALQCIVRSPVLAGELSLSCAIRLMCSPCEHCVGKTSVNHNTANSAACHPSGVG